MRLSYRRSRALRNCRFESIADKRLFKIFARSLRSPSPDRLSHRLFEEEKKFTKETPEGEGGWEEVGWEERGWRKDKNRGWLAAVEISKKKHLPFPCISRVVALRAAAPTLHRALFNGRFFALFGRLINRGASRLYFAPVLRCTGEPWLSLFRRVGRRRGRRGRASPGG